MYIDSKNCQIPMTYDVKNQAGSAKKPKLGKGMSFGWNVIFHWDLVLSMTLLNSAFVTRPSPFLS